MKVENVSEFGTGNPISSKTFGDIRVFRCTKTRQFDVQKLTVRLGEALGLRAPECRIYWTHPKSSKRKMDFELLIPLSCTALAIATWVVWAIG